MKLVVHRATPATRTHEEKGISACLHCAEAVKRVPGGGGSTWVHEATGTVVGSGAPAAKRTLGLLIQWNVDEDKRDITRVAVEKALQWLVANEAIIVTEYHED